MRFLLLLCADTTEVTDYDVPCEEWSKQMAERGILLDALGLHPPNTASTVRVRADGFDVHDDGPGFPAAIAAHAFERFVRGDESRHRGADSGAGLGLSLVQAIVQSHGGTVTLESRTGDTTIRVRPTR